MSPASKSDLITAIDKSAEELHQRIDMQRYLMATILKQRVGDRNLGRFFLSSCSVAEERLKLAIKEAIDTLEQTRTAFKSKRLEGLRKRLTQVLMESK